MSARLEAATKQFGVPMLLSGSFVKLLSPEVRCGYHLKHITHDHIAASLCPPASLQLLTPSTVRPHDRNTCRKLDAVKVIGSDKVTEMWTRDVPIIKNAGFKSEFKAAVDAYILGDWTSAMQRLRDADAVRVSHFVSSVILCFVLPD